MRKAISILVLALTLTCSTYAGEMPNGAPAPPTPQPTPAVQEPTTDGIINTPLTTDADMQNDAAVTFMQVILNLLALS